MPLLQSAISLSGLSTYTPSHGASCVCLTVRRLSEEFEEYKRPQTERRISDADQVFFILKLPKSALGLAMSSFSLSTKKTAIVALMESRGPVNCE